MKFKKLLVLSVLWLTAMSSMAAVADVREKPAFPKTQGFVASESTDQYYYLFNVDAQAFFTEGNAWGTQVSLGPTGLKAAFTPEGDAFLFNDYSNAKNSWKLVFFDNENQMFVDLGSQANYRWGVEENGETFRLFAADEAAGNPGFGDDKPAYREGMYMGWVKGSSSTACVPYLPVAEENCINWAFVAEEDYLPYADAILTYNAAEALKTVLEEAEGLGANIAAQLEVFNNLSSTVEELNAAADALKPIIEARKNLKKVLDDAKAAGFTDTADADAVYGNGDATKAQLEKALTDLNAAYTEWGKGHASVANPADMTSKIVNPNFDNASYSGWSGDAPNMTGSGSHGPANVPEKWNATFNTYQDIADLPAGVYQLGAQTHWRGSWNDMVNKIGPASKLYVTVGDEEFSTPFNYAYGPLNTESMAGQTEFGTSAGEQSHTDEETGITYYIPNDPSCFRLYAEKGLYDTKLIFGIPEGGIRIGVKNPQMMGDADNWSVWDTFTLKYFGSGADAAQLYLDESMKSFSEVTIPDGTIFTESYLTAYEAAYSGEMTANSFDEASAIVKGVNEAKKAIDDNIKLWQDLQKTIDDAFAKYVNTDEYAGIEPEIDDISDYCQFDGPALIEDHELTNEELEAEIAKLNGWIESLIEKSKLEVWNDKDMTIYIKNPDFEGGIEKATDPNGHSGDYGTAVGWHADKYANGNFTSGPFGWDTQMEAALGKANHCYEAWHCHNFDLWQEVEGLPVGMYELEVQGYVRCEVGGYVRGDDIEPDYPSPVVLYMNNAESKLKNVYSESLEELGHSLTTIESWTVETVNELQYPNSMGGAAQCFAWDMYKTTAYGMIAKDGDTFRIGVKMNANQDWWCIFDNFKLRYKTPTVDLVKPELEKALEQIDTTQPMGKSLISQAQAAQQKGQEALASNDGQTMFNALGEIYDVMGAIRASVELFKTLNDANENMLAVSFNSENPTAQAEAGALYNQIADGMNNYSIDDSEVEGLKEQIDLMLTKLNLPEDMANATDGDPKECTKVIKSAGFEDEDPNSETYGSNSSAGWNGAGNLGNDDTQKSVLAMEFWQNAFDMYQTIIGLPKGTYMVTVDAWIRNGGNDENYTAWVEDPTSSMAYLYAVDGDSTVYSEPIVNVMKGLLNDNPGIDGTEEVILGENTFWMPNSLVGGRSYMDVAEAGAYTNSVICKVGDDGKLTVGIKKAEYKGNSWVVLDNFKLYYFGENSSKEVSGDAATAISTMETAVAPVKVEFFSLNGARISKPGKGVAIMKQTLSDGSVKLQKVIVK